MPIILLHSYVYSFIQRMFVQCIWGSMFWGIFVITTSILTPANGLAARVLVALPLDNLAASTDTHNTRYKTIPDKMHREPRHSNYEVEYVNK